MDIREDDPTREALSELIAEHLEDMRRITPPESVHALEPAALAGPDVTFWSVWDGGRLVGCGALKELDATSAEIKSMRTSESYRRRGVGARMLEYLIAHAQERGYERLLLETGVTEAFAAAHALYRRYGFEVCGPFGDYELDPHSLFMCKQLKPGRSRVE